MKRGRLKQRGARVTREADAYDAMRDQLRAEHPGCELGPLIATVDPPHRCVGRYQGPHHLRKTGQGGSAVLRANVRSSCNPNPCNDWVEDHPALAKSLGLVVTESDPELWRSLGRHAEKYSP